MTDSNSFNITIQNPSGGGGTAPAWFAALADKTWGSVASVGTLDAVKPSGAVNHQNIIHAWSGGCVDTDRKSLMVVGGGHSDYSGNEAYELVLTAATPAWVRLMNPSPAVAGDQITGTLSNGQPRSFHTYDMVAYGGGKTYLAGSPATWPNGYSSNGIWRLDRSGTPIWVLLPTRAPGPTSGTFGLDEGYSLGTCAFDSTTGNIYATGSGCFSFYAINTATDAVTTIAGTINPGLYVTSAIAPSLRAWVFLSPTGTGNGGFQVVNLNNNAITSPTLSGSPPRTAAGIVWHPASNAFLIWSGGATLYKLTPGANAFTGTYTLSTVANGGGGVTPTAADSNGTYGRFALVPDLGGTGIDALVAVNSTTQATYVYKLPAGGV